MSEVTKYTVRFDRGQVSAAVVTDEGYLRADAVVTRTGVFTYQDGLGGIRKELRHPDEVFKADSLETLKMRPITNGHPRDRLVTSDNAKDLSIGYTGEGVRVDDKYIIAPLLITDKEGVEQVKASGRRELSLGYTVDLIPEEGEYEGQAYTHRQTNIKYNHLAIVDKARAGPEARIHLDALDAEEVESDLHIINNKESEMAELNLVSVPIAGIEYSAAPEVIAAYNDAIAEAAALKERVAELQAELDKLNAEKDVVSEQLEEVANVDHAEAIRKAVQERTSLLGKAMKMLAGRNTTLNLDEMSDQEIKRAVIKELAPKARLDGQSDVYIQARFDALIEDDSHRNAAISKQRARLAPRMDSSADIVEDAKRKMHERIYNKSKVNNS